MIRLAFSFKFSATALNLFLPFLVIPRPTFFFPHLFVSCVVLFAKTSRPAFSYDWNGCLNQIPWDCPKSHFFPSLLPPRTAFFPPFLGFLFLAAPFRFSMCRPTFYTAAMHVSFKFPATIPNLSFSFFFVHLLSFLLTSRWLMRAVQIFKSSRRSPPSKSSDGEESKSSCLPLFLAGRKKGASSKNLPGFTFTSHRVRSRQTRSFQWVKAVSACAAIPAFQNCSENRALLGEVRQYRRLSSPFTEQNDLCLHSLFLALSFLGEEQ